jgi:hypothetical protein
VLTVGASGRMFTDCQAAEDAANPGDEIAIDPGFVCAPLTLRNKGSSTDWIVIRSAALASLPAEGNRVAPSDAPNMAIIEVNDVTAAVSTDPSAHHHRLVGLEIRLAATEAAENYHLVAFGTSTETSSATQPHDLAIDRCYIHAAANQEEKRGVELSAWNVSIVDSAITEIHVHGQDTQAIAGFNGPGPFKIVNNLLEASTENILFGGDNSAIQNLIASDIEIRRNLLQKPIAWLQSVTSLAGLSGVWEVKNLFELKNAQRVLVSGNTFQYNWADGQSGCAILFTPRSQGTGTPGSGQSWVRVQDVNFVNNVIAHTACGFSILYQDNYDTLAIAQRIEASNNVMYDVGSMTYGGNGRLIQLEAAAQGPMVFDHNTLLKLAGQDYGATIMAEGAFPQHTFTNNLINDEAYGIFAAGDGTGSASIDAAFPDFSMAGNVLAGQSASLYTGFTAMNAFPTGTSSVGFSSDPSAGVSDFHSLALAPSSPYLHFATDGKAAGADLCAIDAAMAGP